MAALPIAPAAVTIPLNKSLDDVATHLDTKANFPLNASLFLANHRIIVSQRDIFTGAGIDEVDAMADRADSLSLFGNAALMDPSWQIGD